MANINRKSPMTPRQRVMAAIAHEQTDRIPCDFWAEKPTMNRVFAHVGHRDEERLLQELGIDLRHMNAIEPAERPIGGGVFQNMWGERYVYKPTEWGPMREDTQGALTGATTLAELEAFDWPTVDGMDYSQLPELCRRHEPYALVYGFADIWQRPALIRGWENMFLDMIERPDWAHMLCRKFTDFYKQDYTRAAQATDGRIDIYFLISDLGTQRGPLISLEMFRTFVAPYVAEMCQTIHGLGGKVMFHSCGDVRTFIPDLIAMGVDLLDPIQPVSTAMSPESLAAEFGGRICFHGGIDVQSLLPSGTPEEVAGEVRRYCRTFGGRGGYILCPSHLFQPDVPPENIYAMYRAVNR